MANAARVFFALWYVFGCIVHVVLAVSDNSVYQPLGETAMFPLFRDLWQSLVMPNIVFFALLLAALEMITGLLILSRGRWVKVGLTVSLVFNLFLIQLGLGSPGAHWLDDLLMNRLPNIIFAVLQVPLFWRRFDRSILRLLRLEIQRVPWLAVADLPRKILP